MKDTETALPAAVNLYKLTCAGLNAGGGPEDLIKAAIVLQHNRATGESLTVDDVYWKATKEGESAYYEGVYAGGDAA